MQSSLEPLLRSNDPPSETEELSLRQLLAETRVALSSSPQDPELELLCQQCELLLAPIRRVPMELITEIILIAWGGFQYEYFRETPFITLNMHKGPWAYTQVSSGWRREILSRPSLWTNLSIACSVETPFTVQIAETLLSRSADHALNLNLDFPLYWEGEEYVSRFPRAKELIEVVVRTSDRWKTASIKVNDQLFPSLQPIKDHLTQLERLHVESSPTGFFYNIARVTECIPIFTNAPALRCLSLGFCAQHYDSIPWSQITHFSFQYDKCTPYLRQMPELTHLQVLDDISSARDSTLLTLPKLIHLDHLHVYRPQDYNLLEVPSLTDISVLWELEDNPVQRVIQPSNIRTVTIGFSSSLQDQDYHDPYDSPEYRYPHWMKDLTSVTTVRVVGQPRPDFCNSLADSPELFPKLHALIFDTRFSSYSVDDWETEYFVRLVQSRIPTLKEVALVVSESEFDGWWESFYGDMRDLEKFGLKVSLKRDDWECLVRPW